MDALVIGGTGLIGRAVVRSLVARGAAVTVYSRGALFPDPTPEVTHLRGDRRDHARFEATFRDRRFDVVVDLACFTEDDAVGCFRAFGGRCEQLVLCSTVCTYGTGVPPGVLVNETFPQEPPSTYGRNKAMCERLLLRAMEQRAFAVTIVRPSHTYGPGAPLLDQLEIDGAAWDRVIRGEPVFCAGDGLGLWQSTHHTDCARLFSCVALEPRTYGEAYNATPGAPFTWRDYYRRVASAFGTTARLIFAPAAWLIDAAPDRFAFLAETARHHGAYSAAKARGLFPSFVETVRLEEGARDTLVDLRRRGSWRDSTQDDFYQRLVDRALSSGFGTVEA